MICTPIKAVPIVVGEILDHVSSSTYIAEISSVKSPVMPSLKKAASSGRLILSLHPLFGPGAEVSAREKMLFLLERTLKSLGGSAEPHSQFNLC